MDQMKLDPIFHKNLMHQCNFMIFVFISLIFIFTPNDERNNTFEIHHVFELSNEFFYSHIGF